MGKHNERLIGLTLSMGDVQYTVTPSIAGLATSYVSVKNNKNGFVHNESLSAVLYHLDRYSHDSDPMLATLDELTVARKELTRASDKIAQLVCDNKDFDFTKNKSASINEIINDLNQLTDKINEASKSFQAEMISEIKDHPPTIQVATNRPGLLEFEVTGLGINETIVLPEYKYLPNHFTREVILEHVLEKISAQNLEILQESGRVIIDGRELVIDTAPMIKM